MAPSPTLSNKRVASSLAYRTGYYVGALQGYQIVSEISPVDGPDFCRGFASGIEAVFAWVKKYLAEGGTFEAALGELMPYYPALRSWMDDADGLLEINPIKPPSSQERRRRQWREAVLGALSHDRWQTTKEIAEQMNDGGPHSARTLNQLLADLETSGRVECRRSVELAKARGGSVQWRFALADRPDTSSQ